ncbi:TIGR03032 family protein [Aeoliella mucimassa]|uniref:Conserved hypothetical protein CHP03032 domain-containing protein n=1 Tax=Aeoliella mucimassa TaxID=2527972 RepID=A0A518AHA9_9BACT|nr:TIGR03032 family protein [Aeoliella mucimassa]QDU54106.1 hypothetical protein Pan181_02860 [Aeoliella mucimassa]
MNDQVDDTPDCPRPQRTWQPQASAGWTEWMADQQVSLAVTTYQVGKLLLLGLSGNQQLAIAERSFRRAMGVSTDGQSLWLATAYQVWRMEHQFDQRAKAAGYDRLFVPRVGTTTGDLDLHDIAIDADGQPVFVATLFNCLATLSITDSFRELWRPPFIDTLTAEDRCHLNGLAMVDGRPKYVTLCAATNVTRAWKSHRMFGGQLWDTESNEPLVTELSMPHSPRWHDGRLWLCNSGTGYLGYIDFAAERFEPVAFVPGYARGLAFVGNYAVVGLSRPRRENKFGGLALDDELANRNMTSYTGLAVVDLTTGDIAHTLELEGSIAELYDVGILHKVRRPTALGLALDALRYNVWAECEGTRRHWRRTPKGK